MIVDVFVGLDNGFEKFFFEWVFLGSWLNIVESIYESNLDMEIVVKV